MSTQPEQYEGYDEEELLEPDLEDVPVDDEAEPDDAGNEPIEDKS